jgi:hypothetical protein
MEDTDGNGLLDTTAAIKPFLDVLREDGGSLNIVTLRSMVLKVLVHPEIFCGFDEFKSYCSTLFQGDTSTAAISLSNTLDLFSYGTLKNYNQKQQEAPDFYLTLNDQAQTKLAQLTILSRIQEACLHGAARITYASLAESLGWINSEQAQEDETWIRKTEDVLIRCLYARVLKGKLCQKTRRIVWETESLPISISRDVPPSQVGDLLAALKGLERRLEAGENEVGQAEGQVMGGLQSAAQYWKTVEEKKKAVQSDAMLKGSGQGGASQRGAFAGSPGAQWLDSGGAGARPSSSRSNKRSRGGLGGNFVADAAFRL